MSPLYIYLYREQTIDCLSAGVIPQGRTVDSLVLKRSVAAHIGKFSRKT